MSELKKKAYLIATTMAILHNNQRYEKGDRIELTAEEAENLSLYVQAEQIEQTEQTEQTEQAAEAIAEATESASDKGKGKKAKGE